MTDQNQIQKFHSDEFGAIDVMMIDGKPYFPATECAEVLGYAKPHNAIARHCAHSLKRGVIDKLGREQEKIFITPAESTDPARITAGSCPPRFTICADPLCGCLVRRAVKVVKVRDQIRGFDQRDPLVRRRTRVVTEAFQPGYRRAYILILPLVFFRGIVFVTEKVDFNGVCSRQEIAQRIPVAAARYSAASRQARKSSVSLPLACARQHACSVRK